MSEILLNHIREGIRHKEFFSSDGKQFPMRPLTSMEVDDAKSHAHGLVDSKLARLIINLRLGKLKLTDELKEYPPEAFINMEKFCWESDYWIVYHSMKDFMPKDFSIDDVRKMSHIHDMATFAINMMTVSNILMMDTVSNSEGVELAKTIFEYHIPLEDAAWKLTPLQHQFLDCSHPGAPKKVANNMNDLQKFVDMYARR